MTTNRLVKPPTKAAQKRAAMRAFARLKAHDEAVAVLAAAAEPHPDLEPPSPLMPVEIAALYEDELTRRPLLNRTEGRARRREFQRTLGSKARR